MKSFFVVIFLLLAISVTPNSAFALTEVMINGYGASKDEAINIGLRNAIEVVNGVFLISETQVTNNSLVDDSILTSSNGYIKSYQVISENKKNGFYSIDMKVSIDDTELNRFIQRVFVDIDKSKLDSDVNLVRSMMDIQKKKVDVLSNAKRNVQLNGYYAEVTGYEIKEVTSSKIKVKILCRLLYNQMAWDLYNKAYSYLKEESSEIKQYEIGSDNGIYITAEGSILYNIRKANLCPGNEYETTRVNKDALVCTHCWLKPGWNSQSDTDCNKNTYMLSGNGFGFSFDIELSKPEEIKSILGIKLAVVNSDGDVGRKAKRDPKKRTNSRNDREVEIGGSFAPTAK